ncbi:hypothetical protein C8R47DRAFT_1109009 [Mycena vitilis]|nr:hypothetical protein C8R47DRAFT_1109009 [Mycena vitilis]
MGKNRGQPFQGMAGDTAEIHLRALSKQQRHRKAQAASRLRHSGIAARGHLSAARKHCRKPQKTHKLVRRSKYDVCGHGYAVPAEDRHPDVRQDSGSPAVVSMGEQIDGLAEELALVVLDEHGAKCSDNEDCNRCAHRIRLLPLTHQAARSRLGQEFSFAAQAGRLPSGVSTLPLAQEERLHLTGRLESTRAQAAEFYIAEVNTSELTPASVDEALDWDAPRPLGADHLLCEKHKNTALWRQQVCDAGFFALEDMHVWV